MQDNEVGGFQKIKRQKPRQGQQDPKRDKNRKRDFGRERDFKRQEY